MAGNQDERRRGGEPPRRTATAQWRLAPLFEPEQAEPAPPPATAPSRTRWVWLLVAWTATLAVDEVIHLLIANRRDAAAERFMAFTIASRQCRRDADA
jgi:hypothetical protein